MVEPLYTNRGEYMRLIGVILSSVLFASITNASTSLKGKVIVDGSSTVFPIVEAVAEDFRKPYPRVRVAIGVSGTGGGFKKFVKGETDINNASRRIKAKEIKLAKDNNITYEEFPVAYDGISVVVSKGNTWVDYMTVAELKRIWEPNSKVKTWKDVRASWPDKPMRLYGPGTDSGTFDYFTEAINGKSHVSRSDYTKSEDDNVLVQGVAADKYALAYFGFAYYKENKATIKAVPIKVNAQAKAISPTMATINNGSYRPLSREIYIYVNPQSISKQSVYEFTKHLLTTSARLVKDVGYVPLRKTSYDASLGKLEKIKLARARAITKNN